MALSEKKPFYAIPSVLAVAFILITTCFIWNIPVRTANGEPDLPRVGSKEKLVELLKESQAGWGTRFYAFSDGVMEKNAVPAPSDAPLGSSNYSQTNTQVSGVDEADLVKTDGQYIYQVSGRQLFIIQAVPANQMHVVAQIEVDDSSFMPQEIYVDSGRLVLIGQSSGSPGPFYEPNLKQSPGIFPPVYRPNTTRALIYDITDRSHPIKSREVDLEGSYLSSRKIGSSLYLISNRYINPYWIQNNDDLLAPRYLDSAAGNQMIPVSYDKISYFPGYAYPNFIMVAGLNLDSTRGADVESYLGNGENVYASVNRLYIALSYYNYSPETLPGSTATPVAENKTLIQCFQLLDGSIQYAGQGQVPGTIVNQFSMDEFQGHFRIATTSGDAWRSGQQSSSNNVYVLDENLKTIGRLEGIAPGEKIYSTRFMGNRAFMVTFRTVDPFFVIDISNPGQPTLLGKLKIPGFSDYLHPYDANHIIGFGKDTIELKNDNGGTQAYYTGLKVAIFDVSDVTHPVEMSRQIIGDRGTDSELLTNHKALLFSAENHLLAFPVTVMETNKGNQDPTAYGSFTFQGAYIYHIDLVKGLQFQGRITHLTSDDYQKSGDNWYNSDQNIQRILYINNTLYTLSNAMIEAHQLPDLAWVSMVTLPNP